MLRISLVLLCGPLNILEVVDQTPFPDTQSPQLCSLLYG